MTHSPEPERKIDVDAFRLNIARRIYAVGWHEVDHIIDVYESALKETMEKSA